MKPLEFCVAYYLLDERVTSPKAYLEKPYWAEKDVNWKYVQVIEKSAYDALLAESDFNKESLVKCWNEINSLVAKLNLEFSGHQSTAASLKGAKADYDFAMDQLKLRDERIKKLGANLKIAVEALEFYASPRAEFANGEKVFDGTNRSHFEFYPNEDIAVEALNKIRGESQ